MLADGSEEETSATVEEGFVAFEQDDDDDDDARASTSDSEVAASHADVGSDSGSESASGSDASTSEADSTSDDDTEDDAVTPEYLQSLLDKARRNAREEARMAHMLRQEREAENGFGEQDMIRIGDEEDNKVDQPLPPLDPGVLPPPYFEFGKTRHEAPTRVQDPDVKQAEAASSSVSVPAPPEDPNADWKQLTRKERKALKNKTTGPGWFDLPAPAEADLPRLYREVEALRLRNQLDPKRFYRKDDGEGKGIKGLPKHFAIGTILPTATPFGTASADNLPRAYRKRTFVDELVDDAEARRYAKKKFDELQNVRGAKGKKTLHKKNELRKPKW